MRRIVTVIFRDDAPVIHAGGSPAYRTAKFGLTDAQAAIVKTEGNCETVDKLILEPEPPVKGSDRT